jgi:hypothetical protein
MTTAEPIKKMVRRLAATLVVLLEKSNSSLIEVDELVLAGKVAITVRLSLGALVLVDVVVVKVLGTIATIVLGPEVESEKIKVTVLSELMLVA